MNTLAAIRFGTRIRLSVPHTGGTELTHVREAFASNWLSTSGPQIEALEREFSLLMGLPSAALSSGTASLHLALRLIGVGPGDEVVVPTLTFVATCNPVLYEKAIPVFMDSDPNTWNLDPGLLSAFLERRAGQGRLPKGVIVVHLYGQSADLDPILEVCARYGVSVIEDAAEALGTLYKGHRAGTLGDVGVFSLNGNKIITSTGGGLLVSPRADWVEKVRYWSSQARDPDPVLNHYLHSELGYNYRLSNVLAAIARGQFEVLPLRVQQRRAIAFRYRDALADLPGLTLMPQASYGLHTNWLSCFLVDEARFGLSQANLIRFLESANIEARPVWKPMHTQKLYQNCECVGGAVAEDLSARGLCLPSSSSLTEEEHAFVVERIREAYALAHGGPRHGVKQAILSTPEAEVC